MQAAASSVYVTLLWSSVNFAGGKAFLTAKIKYIEINKIPEFYTTVARQIFSPIFFLGGGGGTCCPHILRLGLWTLSAAVGLSVQLWTGAYNNNNLRIGAPFVKYTFTTVTNGTQKFCY